MFERIRSYLGEDKMKLLRETIRRIILEACKRDRYWGFAAAGTVVICSEDSSIYLHQRPSRKWAYPGGGLHVGREIYYDTPIPEELRVDQNDPRLFELALDELEEEAGYLGLPKYNLLDEFVTYEDCGFIYKTFIVDVSLDEKLKWTPQPAPEHGWEVLDDGWFSKDEWQKKDLHRGFTPLLVEKIKGYIQ